MEELKKTCLYESHVALGAQMSPFGGFIMPIQYSDIISEHNAVRNSCGMFDVSHMGEFVVDGPDAGRFVNHVFTNDVGDIPEGKILYGMMLYPDGGTVDDLLVYRLADGADGKRFLMVVNAANIGKDYDWACAAAEGMDVKLENRSDEYGEIALQGPEAEKTAKDVLGMDLSDLVFYTFKETSWEGFPVLVSRTGYTGEDGFEFYASQDVIRRIWAALLHAGVTPCGLGCRDTLRFEVGLPLYGHELDGTISPLEAGLGIFVKTDKPDFIGKEAILRMKAEGLKRKVVGIELFEKAVPRSGYPVEADGKQIGEVTTGYISISTGKSVCMALVDAGYAAPGTEVAVRIRKKTFPGKTCKKRFYEKHYKNQ